MNNVAAGQGLFSIVIPAQAVTQLTPHSDFEPSG